MPTLVQNISTQYEDSLLDLALKMPMAIIKVVNHGEALMSLVYDATFGDSLQVTQTEKDVSILIDFGVSFITLSCVIKAKDSEDGKKFCSLVQKWVYDIQVVFFSENKSRFVYDSLNIFWNGSIS